MGLADLWPIDCLCKILHQLHAKPVALLRVELHTENAATGEGRDEIVAIVRKT